MQLNESSVQTARQHVVKRDLPGLTSTPTGHTEYLIKDLLTSPFIVVCCYS